MKLGDVYRYSGLLYGVNLVTSFVTFLVMILVSRAITKEELGLYGMFQAFFVLGAATTGMGVSQAIVKFIAERRVDKREIHTLVAAILGAMTLVLVGIGLMAIRVGHEILGLALITLPAFHLFEFSLSYARGHLWRGVESSILVVSSLMNSLLIVVLLQVFPDHHGPIYGQIASTYAVAFALIYLFFRYPREPRPRLAPVRGGWPREFTRIAGPIFVSAILFGVSDVTDRFIIEHHLGLEVVGEYFLAMTLFTILDKPIALLSRVLLSHLCGLGVGPEREPHIEPVRKLIAMNVVLLPAFALLVIAILPAVMTTVFNKDYTAVFDILAITSIVVVVKAFEVVNSMLAIARNNAESNMYSQLVSLVVYLPVMLLLVRYVGVFGAAAAMVVRWIVYAGFQFLRLQRSGVETVSPYLMVRALVAYLAAIGFFAEAPWAMLPVYLLVGTALRLWRIDEVSRSLAAWRIARAAEK